MKHKKMEYLDIKEWLRNLSYEDLIYLCARNDYVPWFPHHDNDKAAVLRHLEELDCDSLNYGHGFLECLYRDRGLLD